MNTHERVEESGRSFQDSLSNFISLNHGSQEQKQKKLRELINMAFQQNKISSLIECYTVSDGFVEEKKLILQLIEHGVFDDLTIERPILTKILPHHRLYEVLKNKKII